MLDPDTLVQGRYRIVRHLREGGMGSVYEALDTRLGNRVALKRAAIHEDDVRQAFRLEARILSALRHPALPVVIDYFSEDGEDYLVMDFVDGEDFSDLLRRANGPVPHADALRWADRLLDALSYLHERGIVHRDIKPANLKLTREGEVVLLDFGISKGSPDWQGTHRSILSGGTNGYSPFEQLMDFGTDARSDLYALGVTLYQLLTGVLPPDARARAKAKVANRPDPVAPADRLNAAVPPAVARALERAMAHEREDRYASARELRDDLARAVGAPAPTATIPTAPPAAIPAARPASRERAPAPSRPPTLRFGAGDRVTSAAFSPDGRLAFSAAESGAIRMWEVDGGREAGRLEGHAGAVHGVGVSADGRLLISGGADASVRVGEVATGRELARLAGHAAAVRGVAFSPDATVVVSGDADGRVIVWDVTGGQGLYGIEEPGGVGVVAVSPDGRLALAAGDARTVGVWELETGREVARLGGHRQLVYGATFSPDSRLVLSGGGDATARVHDAETGAERIALAGHRSALRSVAFSRDGRTALSGSIGGAVRAWDAATGVETGRFEGEMGLLGVGTLPPEHRLAFAYSSGGVVSFWEMERA
jgi:predicted Ser/Thr protein kinase